jgi:hypothetical protein
MLRFMRKNPRPYNKRKTRVWKSRVTAPLRTENRVPTVPDVQYILHDVSVTKQLKNFVRDN